MKRVYFVSLGCPKNRVDTEVALAQLLQAGWEPASGPAEADLLVVNTCGFIESARKESVDTLLDLARFRKKNKRSILVAMGCLAQDGGEELAEAMPELDLVIGTGMVDRLAHLLSLKAQGSIPLQRRVYREGDKFLPSVPAPRVLTQSPAFTYLKVADGCSRACAFCTIPRIKGAFQSRPIKALVEEAKQLAQAGVKELVLVAQDLSRYGAPGRHRLMQLLDALEKVDGIEWIRLMYLYPHSIPPGLIDRMASGGKVLPYVDMPLQHIDDRVLALMRRGTTAAQIRRTICKFRDSCPEVTLRTTFIVGHPGEDEQAFARLEAFLDEARFDHVGVFTFSPEPGTLSATLPGKVSTRIARARRRRLMEVQQAISLSKNKELIGRTVQVLVDMPPSQSRLVSYGRTPRQAPEVDGRTILHGARIPPGHLVDAVVTEATPYDLRVRVAT